MIVTVLIFLTIFLTGSLLFKKENAGKKTNLQSRLDLKNEYNSNNEEEYEFSGIRGRFYNQYVSKIVTNKGTSALAKKFHINLEKLDHKIKDSGLGKKITTEEVLVLKSLGTIGGLSFILIGAILSFNILLIIIGFVIYFAGSFLPIKIIENKYRKRNFEIINMLPDFIDLTRAVVESGMTINLAIDAIVSRMSHPLADQFRLVSIETQATNNWVVAMENMAFRNDLDALSDFVSDICIAVKNGTPIGKVLEKDASMLRTLKTSTMEAKAKKLSIKLIIPLVVFCFGPLLALILGPVVIDLITGM